MTIQRTIRHRSLKRWAGVLAASGVLALAGLVVPGATPSYAAAGDLVCLGNLQLNFVPALTATNTTATIYATAHDFNCTSPNGNYPNLMSASVIGTGSVTALGAAPCSLLLTATGTGTQTWSPTGEQSGATFTVNTNPIAGTITVNAQIVSGPLAGDTVTSAPLVVNPNADCAVNGLKSLTSNIGATSFN